MKLVRIFGCHSIGVKSLLASEGITIPTKTHFSMLSERILASMVIPLLANQDLTPMLDSISAIVTPLKIHQSPTYKVYSNFAESPSCFRKTIMGRIQIGILNQSHAFAAKSRGVL